MEKNKQKCLMTSAFHYIKKHKCMGRFRVGIRNICISAFAVISVCPASASDTQSVFDKIIQNVVDQQLSNASISYEDSQTSDFLLKLRADGSFPDIDYKSVIFNMCSASYIWNIGIK